MKPFAEWRIFADPRLVPLVVRGVEAYCQALELAPEHAMRLQLAVEGVLNYCTPLARESLTGPEVTARLYLSGGTIRVEVEHDGARGPLDQYFEPGAKEPFKCVSFEALGMSMAKDILDEMVCRHVPRLNAHSGLTRYCLGYDPRKPRSWMVETFDPLG